MRKVFDYWFDLPRPVAGIRLYQLREELRLGIPLERDGPFDAIEVWSTAVGERRIQLFRTFNAREGLGRKDDKLPKKFYKQLAGTGPTAGIALTHEEVDAAIDHYYKLAGLNEDGAPTPDGLKRLDLNWAVDYLPA